MYGALLATVVTARTHDSLAGPAAAVPAERRGGLHALLVDAYDGAFHTVTGVLGGVCLVLLAVVLVLLRGRRCER